ncbi:MAG TPA: putative glycolipid-binding domain-containing protein [Thermoanaerobaculia bacterium]|jgi:hypothetical protein|nr:putative glycolipid-binding domain-containing protein [Thermoanaerobaculia bacterium]
MERETHAVLWRRRDLPGHEACRVTALATGWRIAGTAVFLYERQACRLDYTIGCDATWRTLAAKVLGWVGDQDVEVEVLRDLSGDWQLNGRDCPEVAGCIDIDLNFSPVTNTLPIRRLDLKVGEAAPVRAAWLRFPSFSLEPLEQSYARLDKNLYRYESAGGRVVARIGVDEQGLVTEYGDIWAREEINS